MPSDDPEAVDQNDALITVIGETSGPWRVEVNNLRHLQALLGADVLINFARCFALADRLIALFHLGERGELAAEAMRASERPPLEHIQKRDLSTIVLLVAGLLRELAGAARHLRKSLEARGLLVGAQRETLEAIENVLQRWDQDDSFKTLRDQASFHVDPAVVGAGIEELCRAGQPVSIADGDGESNLNTSMTFGLEAVWVGLHQRLSPDVLLRTLGAIGSDLRLPFDLQHLFVTSCRFAGVKHVERPWDKE